MENTSFEAESQHDEQPMLLEVIKEFGMAQDLPVIKRSSTVEEPQKIDRHHNVAGPPNQHAKDHGEFSTGELAEQDEQTMEKNRKRVLGTKRKLAKVAGSLQELSNHFLMELDRISSEDKQASEEGDHMFIEEGTVNEYFQDVDQVVAAFVDHHKNKPKVPESPHKNDKTW